MICLESHSTSAGQLFAYGKHSETFELDGEPYDKEKLVYVTTLMQRDNFNLFQKLQLLFALETKVFVNLCLKQDKPLDLKKKNSKLVTAEIK